MTEKPGSTTKPGYLYHEPAFSFGEVKFHRNDNRQRLDILLRSQNWWNQGVLDLGCNAGFFSLRLAMEGARVVGIDPDVHALSVAKNQAREYGIENAYFATPDPERRWLRSKDVLLAFSVLPWIYQTEPDAEAYVKKLFEIPVAYVEIQYPPDGRASVPGVTDDKTARQYLEQFYTHVVNLGVTTDETDGVLRKRTIWKCIKDEIPPPLIYGSQGVVGLTDHTAIKMVREPKKWDAHREAEFLKQVAARDISPKVISTLNGILTMTRIHGWPLTSGKTNMANLVMQFERIAKALEEAGIRHNDIRPANLIIGADYNIYLIDYGQATRAGEDPPEGVNPVYGTNDRDALQKILMQYPKWQEVR